MRTVIAFVLLCSLASGQQIEIDRAEIRRWGDHVEHVDGQAYGATSDIVMEALSTPADDSNRWHITVLSMKGCAGCERLKQDLNNPQLDLWNLVGPDQKGNAWASLHIYDKDRLSDSWRGYKAQSYPWIVVQPPLSGVYGSPSTLVWEGSYSGNPQQLFQTICDRAKSHVMRISPQPQPTPQPAPNVAPPMPIPGPVTPQPNITPTPLTPPPITPQPPAPQFVGGSVDIFIVEDPKGILDDGKKVAVKAFATWLQNKYGGDAKVSALTVAEAMQLGLPVTTADAPAIVVMQGDRVRAYVSRTITESLYDQNGEFHWTHIASLIMATVAAWFVRTPQSMLSRLFNRNAQPTM